MGKYIDKSGLKVPRNRDGKFRFKAKVAVHGKNIHTEQYSISGDQLQKARDLGYLNTGEGETVTYHDWKPIGGARDIEGGIREVKSYTFDDRYVYAHTEGKTFSLPKYLYPTLPRKDYILFGKREK